MTAAPGSTAAPLSGFDLVRVQDELMAAAVERENAFLPPVVRAQFHFEAAKRLGDGLWFGWTGHPEAEDPDRLTLRSDEFRAEILHSLCRSANAIESRNPATGTADVQLDVLIELTAELAAWRILAQCPPVKQSEHFQLTWFLHRQLDFVLGQLGLPALVADDPVTLAAEEAAAGGPTA